MNKFRFVFALLVGLFSIQTGLAQVPAQTSAKADAIVKASQKKFNSLADVTAKFSYTITNPNMQKPIAKKGDVVYKKNKYKVVLPDEEIFCNAVYVWVVSKADEEVTKTDYDPKETFSVDKVYKIYNEQTKSRYDAEEATAHHITLFSTVESADIWKTEVWINKTSQLIDKAIMYGRNGSKYEYTLTSMTPNTGVQDAVFTPNEKAYTSQGYILNDLTEK